MGLTRLAVKRPLTMIMMILGLVVLGFRGFTLMQVERYPKVDFPFISVVVVFPGASPDDVETLVVKPVEDAEKLSVAFHVETGPVIPDTISILSIVSYAADSNYGYFLLLRELDGVGQKVHHHLPDKPYVTVGGRERLS